MRNNKFLSAIMILCLMLLMPVRGYAAETEGVTEFVPVTGSGAGEIESIQFDRKELTQYAVGRMALEPELADGNHEKWIDRIADLPDYARGFYDWLVANAGPDGALVDVTKIVGRYGYNTYDMANECEYNFTFAQGASKQDIYDAAYAVANGAKDAEIDNMIKYMNAVYVSFDREHPEVFWLGSSWNYFKTWSFDYVTTSTTTGVLTLKPEVWFCLKAGDTFDIRGTSYRNVDVIKTDMEKLEGYVQEILAGCTAETRYEKIQYLNRWLTTHNCYNSASDLSNIDSTCRESICALEGRSGNKGPVCEAYARAFKTLCDRLEIPCVLVDGVSFNNSGSSGNHMWNSVQMEDGKWYAVDVTWNDPVYLGADDPDAVVSGVENEKYLLIGSNTVVNGMTFKDSHMPLNSTGNGSRLSLTNGPLLNPDAYVFNPTPDTYAISGSVTSFLDAEEKVTVVLTETGSDTALWQAQLYGLVSEYFFDGLKPGNYTIIVSKADHVSREYAVVLGEANATQDLDIWPVGDVSGDGSINIADYVKVLKTVKDAEAQVLTGYALKCADINNDTNINIVDYVKILAHAKGSALLW